MPRVTRALLGVLALAVLALIVRGCRDYRDDVRLVEQHQAIARDDSTRLAFRAAVDSAARALSRSAAAAARVDTLWRSRPGRARVDSVLMASVPDTVKLDRLVHIVDTLLVRGDSLDQVCRELANDCQRFRAAALLEQTASAREVADLKRALASAERGRRRWGLGCAAGYGAARVPASGQVVVAPGVSCGLAWRW
jgi:hypothetical protein